MARTRSSRAAWFSFITRISVWMLSIEDFMSDPKRLHTTDLSAISADGVVPSFCTGESCGVLWSSAVRDEFVPLCISKLHSGVGRIASAPMPTCLSSFGRWEGLGGGGGGDNPLVSVGWNYQWGGGGGGGGGQSPSVSRMELSVLIVREAASCWCWWPGSRRGWAGHGYSLSSETVIWELLW